MPQQPQPPGGICSINAVTLRTGDMAACIAFYQALGMKMDGLFEGPTTPDLEWPTWIVYCAVPFGSALMCFRFLQVCVSFIRTGELPQHDHGHVEGIEEVADDEAIYRHEPDLHPKDLVSDDNHKNPKGGR